ncbi:hypothetical protein AGDE_07412 [Angomonas deanei]|nr:hypothetical protein AGDE_11896 [Angomonas deanei]EPY35372.1 hypothetical protein AGDE_07412 [Angomonas deanei]|eukprot:EPY25312.1 hypothetical protein AGDE_11896 [Angomonas deanei]
MFNSRAKTALVTSVRGVRRYHLPGWKTMSSTKDARTREQREVDRKARQIEKLPKPEALHDFQYPYEKTVLSDYMFQYPVFENELDTPTLFHLTPPPNFFLYWNASDFNRTAYPEVPEMDHRVLVPSATEQWVEHQARAEKYLEKHEIVPQYVPYVKHDVNLSVVFPGQYQTRAQLNVDEETGEPIPPPAPETSLTNRNFWFTSHCGNYIELCELQQPPSIFFVEDDKADGQAFYTLLMVSPDFPYRVPSSEDAGTQNGFFLNYMVTNLPGGKQTVVDGKVTGCEARKGDVVIPYVAPLPTEDAGTTRHICLLYRQTGKVNNVKPLSAEEEAKHFPLSSRAQFRLHDPAHMQGDIAASLESLRDVESVLVNDPSAATFFQTKWDICVQEYYEKVGLPEPALPVDEQLGLVLDFHSKGPEELRVRARHRPDGSTNMGDDPNFWGQYEDTNMMKGTVNSMFSSRTRR